MKMIDFAIPCPDIDVQTARRIKGPKIPLRSGVYFDFLNPESCAFTIEDVVHGLSNICRFGGHAEFYSVAQHSVHVSEVVELVAPEHALAALMHDAHEFVMGDMVSPLKELCPDYVALEKRIEPVILGRFGLSLPLDSCVRAADLRMLATEQQQLWPAMVARDRWASTYGREPYPMIIPEWTQKEARRHFMRRFYELGGRGA